MIHVAAAVVRNTKTVVVNKILMICKKKGVNKEMFTPFKR